MRLDGDNYHIWYESAKHTVFFEGSIRLWDPSEYGKIRQFLLDIHNLDIPNLDMNFTGLDFLNSSGISTLCKFILEIRKADKLNLNLICSDNILWQRKSFENLARLWDRIKVLHN